MAQVDDAPRASEEVTQAPPPVTTAAYLRASVARIKDGDTGVLPVIAGLLLVSVLFESLNGNFLTAGNLVNLLVQAAVFSILAMGQVFALLLGEIDLSIGFVAGLSAVIRSGCSRPSAGRGGWRSSRPSPCAPRSGRSRAR